MKPLWESFGQRAGYLRNLAMLQLEPDLVIAFTNGSPGTQHTIDEARRRGIPVEIHGTERAKPPSPAAVPPPPPDLEGER